MSNIEQLHTTVLHESATPAVVDLQGQLDEVEQRVDEANRASSVKRILGHMALKKDLVKRSVLRNAVFEMKERTGYQPWLEEDQNKD